MPTYGGNGSNNTLSGDAGGIVADDSLAGFGGNDTLYGGGGNDTLDGGLGADGLYGGAGDDLYIVDNALDVVVEGSAQGLDTVNASIGSYTLTANVENLTYTGAGSFSGAGNALNNVITGGAAADTLDGGTGVDTLVGGGGGDLYFIRNSADTIIEGVGAGTDSVKAYVDFDLGLHAANVENLVLVAVQGATMGLAGSGNALVNVISGTALADTLDGGVNGAGLAGDTLQGGAGDDTYIVRNAADSVQEAANGGRDTLQTTLSSYDLTSLANVENLSFIGAGAFVGTGNAAANVITGGAGDDVLAGGVGNDTLYGGAGADTANFSGTSTEYTITQNGDGSVTVTHVGGTHTDGTDVLFGVETAHFSDINIALAAGTHVVGGAAAETLTGTDYADTIEGNGGDDSLVGGAGSDQLFGGAGADTLNGGPGADSLTGGDDGDTYIVDNANDTVAEAGVGGVDTVLTSLSAYTLGANLEALTFTGTGGFTGVGNALDNSLTGGGSADSLSGGAGADTLTGGVGNDTLVGGAGNDLLNGGDGTDTAVFSGDQANYAITGDGSGGFFVQDTVGGEGTDHLVGVESAQFAGGTVDLTNLVVGVSQTGTAGDDALSGGGGPDTLIGLGGNDTLDGGAGGDSLVGGTGNDLYLVDSASDAVVENVGEGVDTVSTALGSYTLGANVEQLTHLGAGGFTGVGNALDNLIVATSSAVGVSLSGLDGNDTLQGGSGADTLDGGTGADSLVGGGGNDVYVVDDAGDRVVEGAGGGADTVNTSLAAYTLADNVETLVFTGTSGFAGTGNAGDNAIVGGAGSDSLVGGAGSDTLTGGLGNDTLDGSPHVGGDRDTAVFSGAVGDYTVTSDGTGYYVQDTRADPSLNEGRDYLLNIQTAVFAGGQSVDLATFAAGVTLSGTSANETLTGGAGADTLRGFGGNDVLIGNGAADSLDGGIGNDTIYGGDGGDSLIGGTGSDSMFGGLGDDTYVVDQASSGSGASFNPGDIVVENPGEGIDTVQATISAYTLTANVENLTYTGLASASFRGTGNADANVITGGGAADSLDGGAGADTLIGGGGDDLYFVDNAADVIVEQAGGGSDSVKASVSYTLGANVEKLVLTASGLTGTGNSDANLISGTAGADTLDGGAGADTLQGGAGDDTYVIDVAGDSIQESAGGGTDTVAISAASALTSYTLGTNLENLVYRGTAAFTGTGNASNNAITGGAGNDSLVGGAGDDTLQGGAGNDTLDGGTNTTTPSPANASLTGDVAAFAGASTDYTVSTTAGVTTVVDNRAGHPDGTDTLRNVESVRFSDGTFSLVSNNAPIAGADSFSVAEDSSVAGNVLTNDRDFDAGTTLRVASVTVGSTTTAVAASGATTFATAHGLVSITAAGAITYTPAHDYNGADGFTYTVSDQSGAANATSTATVSFAVTPVNDAPVAADDAKSITEDTATVGGNVLFNDSDVDGGTTLKVDDAGLKHLAHGDLTLNADGSYTYQLTTAGVQYLQTGQSVADSYTYTADDQSGAANGAAQATLTITITGVNDAPTAGVIAPVTVNEDHVSFTQNLLTGATDPEGDTLSVTSLAVTTTDGNGQGATTPAGADSLTGSTLTVNPGAFNSLAAGETRTLSFDYTIDDGHQGATTGHYQTTVTGVNDAVAFTAAAPAAQEVTEDVGVVVGKLEPAAGALAFTDPDTTDTHTTAVTYAAASGSDAHATAVAGALQAGTDFSVTATLDEAGHTVGYQWSVSDSAVQGLGAGESVTLTAHVAVADAATSDSRDVTLVVHGANDAPDAMDDTATTTFGAPVTIAVLANDTDVDADTLIVSSVGTGVAGPQHGAVVINADNTLTYTADAGFSGVDHFSYSVSDGNGGSGTAQVSVTVQGPVVLHHGATVSYFTHIQDAVTASVSGDSIDVAAGTYREQVTVVGKAITITGAGQGQTIIEAPDAANLAVNATDPASSRPDKFAVVAATGGADLHLSGVTVDGRDQGGISHPAAAYDFVGVYGLDSNVSVDASRVTRVEQLDEAQPSGAHVHSAIIVADTMGAAHTATVSNSTIDGFEKNAIVLSGVGLNGNVHDNTITGAGEITTIAQNGVELINGATGDIGHNTISGLDYTPATFVSSGVLLYGAGDNVSVHDNSITGGAGHGDAGIVAVDTDHVSAHGNTLTDLASGLEQDGAFTTPIAHTNAGGADDNSFSGNDVAIGFYPTGATGYAFAGSTGADDLEGSDGADTLSGAGGDDTLAGGAGNDSLAGGAGRDTANYSGTAADHVIVRTGGEFTSVSGGADGADSLSGVETLHFADGVTLDAGAPVELFHAGHLVGTFVHIQDAIDAASSTDTITVAAGTYAENLTIAAGKSGLTILGANANVDPNTGTRGAESVITPGHSDTVQGNIVTVLANDVTISGFTLNGDNTSIGGGRSVGGADANVRGGIQNGVMGSDGSHYSGTFTPISGLVVTNNVIENIYGSAVLLKGNTGAPLGGDDVSHNLISNLTGAGTALINDENAHIHDNTMRDVYYGVRTESFGGAAPAGQASEIDHNDIQAAGVGVWLNNHFGSASTFTVDHNTISAGAAGSAAADVGVFVSSIYDTTGGVVVQDNAVSGLPFGVALWNDSHPTTVEGGSISGSGVGVHVFDVSTAATDPFGFGAGAATSATVSGVAFSGNGVDAEVDDTSANGSATSLTLAGEGGTQPITVAVHGSEAGFSTSAVTAPLHVTGSAAAETLTGGAAGDTLDGAAGVDTAAYAGPQSAYTVTLSADGTSFASVSSTTEGSDTLVSIEKLTFGAGAGATTLDLTQAVRLFHGGQLVATYGDIQTALDASADGDTVQVAAGTYAGDLTVAHGVTLQGANAGKDGTAASRVAETILTGHVQITATAAATIDGFEFLDNRAYSLSISDNFVALGVSSGAAGVGHVIENSVFDRDPASDPSGFDANTYVPGGAQPTHRAVEISDVTTGTGVTVTGNLFTGGNPYGYAGDDWRSDVYSNGGAGSTKIVDNTFENSRSAINADNFGHTVQISGNHFDTPATAVSIGVGSDVTDLTSIHDNTLGRVDTDFNFANLTTSVTFNAAATGNALGSPAPGGEPVFIDGGHAGDSLTGATGASYVAGEQGDDTLAGGSTADTLDGGAGVDTATFATGTLAYDAASHHWTVTQGGVVDTLIGVEKVVIGGQTYDLVDQGGANVGGYQSVQAGVDAAASGDIVKVAAGTYHLSAGGLNLSKSVTIQGAQAGVDGPAHTGAETEFDGPASGHLFNLGSGVDVSVDGIRAVGNSVVLATDGQAVSFTNSVFALTTTADNAFYTGAPNVDFTFSHNALTQSGGNHDTFELFRGAHVTVSDNSFTGVGAAGSYLPLILNLNADGVVSGNSFSHVDIGVLVASTEGPGLTITGNTFDDVHRDPSFGGYGAGVVLYQPGASYAGPIVIDDNAFTNSDAGVRTSGAGSLVGLAIAIDGDTLSGVAHPGSVGLSGVLHFTDASGTSAPASSLFYGGPDANTITGDSGVTNALYGGDGSDTLQGAALNDRLDGGAGTDTAVFGGSVTAANVSYSGSDTYLVTTAGGGSDTLTGVEVIQDAGHHIYLVDTDAELQAAASAAVDGDVIKVAAGRYDTGFTLTHGVTLDGANVGVDGAAARGAETIFAGHVQITSTAAVTIDGVEFLDANPVVLSISDNYVALGISGGGAGAGHVVENSTFVRAPSSYPAGFSATTYQYSNQQQTHRGVEISNVAAGTAVTVAHDAFTGPNAYGYAGDDWRSGVYSNGGAGVTTITDNTFSNTRNAINADSFGHTVEIAANHFQNPATAISLGVGSDVASLTSIHDNDLGRVDTDFNFANLTTPITFDAAGTGNTLSAAAPAGEAVFIEGGPAGDSLTGVAGSNYIQGDAGDDTLQGGAAADVLVGGTGTDTVRGYTGATLSIVSGHWAVTQGGVTDQLTGVEKVVVDGHTYELVDQLGANGGFHSVQAAIDSASDGDTILVAPGSYTETKDSQGTTFGLLIDKAVTLQGVDAAGAAITTTGGIAATVVSGAQSDFGTNVYVTGDGVTVRGLAFQATDSGTGEVNKAIEVVGDAFHLTASTVGAAAGVEIGSSIYIDDQSVPIAANGNPNYSSTISTYDISGNTLYGDVVVANGAGHGHPASGLVIAGNSFLLNPGSDTHYNWGVILDGEETGVGYRNAPIANPTITGNTFAADYTTDQRLHALDDTAANLPTRAYVDAFLSNNAVGNYAFATETGGAIHAVHAVDAGAGTDTFTFNVWVNASDASAAAATGDVLQVFSTGGTDVQTILTDQLQVMVRAGSSDVNLALGAGVHKLQISDFAAGQGIGVHVAGNDLGDSLIGASGADTLVGGAGADTLLGKGGIDVLTGGAGSDLFNFQSATGGLDAITDFTHGADKIGIQLSGFGIDDDVIVRFQSGAGAHTAANAPTFFYHTDTGVLEYDVNGQASAFATLDGHPTLTAADLFIY